MRLKIKPEPLWIAADDPAFDGSELGSFADEVRATLKFLIEPTTRMMIRNSLDSNTHEKFETEFIDGKRERRATEKLDDIGFQNELVDKIIVDWEGLQDEEGKIIPCDRENKLILADSYPGLAIAWVNISREIMDRHNQAQGEQEKNLPTSPMQS